MCDMCHHRPCDPRCPNAEEPKAIFYCSECEEAIYAGETAYDLGRITDELNRIVCADCVKTVLAEIEFVVDPEDGVRL
jgi:hypothetical protein